jgi:hypothetical protein
VTRWISGHPRDTGDQPVEHQRGRRIGLGYLEGGGTTQKRTLGKTHREVSAIGLGCMGIGFSYGMPKDKQEMTSRLQAAVERGVTS